MKFLLTLAIFLPPPVLALEPIRVSDSAYFIRSEAGVPSAASCASILGSWSAATATPPWMRRPTFEAANRRNAYNTYIRVQGGDK